MDPQLPPQREDRGVPGLSRPGPGAPGARAEGAGPRPRTGHRYRFTVAAIDTHGYMGPAARVSASTADPAPTEGRAHAFLLASTGESFRDLQRHYRQVGTVYPTYFECREIRAGRSWATTIRW